MDPDALEQAALAWRVSDKLVRLCAGVQLQWHIDPLLYDHVAAAMEEFLCDLSDDAALEQLYDAFAEFMEAVRESMG
jgi:hypothetical protein